jgi:hypothetical protein
MFICCKDVLREYNISFFPLINLQGNLYVLCNLQELILKTRGLYFLRSLQICINTLTVYNSSLLLIYYNEAVIRFGYFHKKNPTKNEKIVCSPLSWLPTKSILKFHFGRHCSSESNSTAYCTTTEESDEGKYLKTQVYDEETKRAVKLKFFKLCRRLKN